MIPRTSSISSATASCSKNPSWPWSVRGAAARTGSSALNRVLPACCRAGLVIVSGMAFGIDSMAHKVALREKGGTLGVNAGGLLHLTPPGNSLLIRKIVELGGIISEFPLDVAPPVSFPHPQPRHLRGVPGGAGGGGRHAQRFPDHRPAGPGPEPRGPGRARQHRLAAEPGDELPAAAGRQAGHRGRRPAGRVRPGGPGPQAFGGGPFGQRKENT